MTEENIYDDCNWKNKPLTTAVQINGAWYSLDYMEFEHRQMKHINEGMKNIVFNDFFNFEKALAHLGEEGVSTGFTEPNDPNVKMASNPAQEVLKPIGDCEVRVQDTIGQTAFEKWGEGLEWGMPPKPTKESSTIHYPNGECEPLIDNDPNLGEKISNSVAVTRVVPMTHAEYAKFVRDHSQSDECSGDLILP